MDEIYYPSFWSNAFFQIPFPTIPTKLLSPDAIFKDNWVFEEHRLKSSIVYSNLNPHSNSCDLQDAINSTRGQNVAKSVANMQNANISNTLYYG